MDAQVEVEAKDGDPGEAADEDKVEEVAEKAAHVVPRQAAGHIVRFPNPLLEVSLGT